MWKAEIPLQGRQAVNEIFFSPLNEGQERVTSFLCDNLSLSSVISVLAPLILIVLYNCGDVDLAVFEVLAYPFIIT